MNARWFDGLARSLARPHPRRGLFRSGAATALGALFGERRQAGARWRYRRIALRAVQLHGCRLRLLHHRDHRRRGETVTGDVILVLFATQLADDAPQEAAGFVRWLDPNAEGGLMLESVGPVAYTWPEGEQHFRNVTGVMSVNGQDEQPFQLEVFDAGPGLVAQDTARLIVGDLAAGASSGFGYEAAGTLVSGDLQLLRTVAPITPALKRLFSLYRACNPTGSGPTLLLGRRAHSLTSGCL